MKLVTARILQSNGNRLILEADEPIAREIIQKNISTVEVRLDDGRTISAAQRKKIFAIIRDIALWNGDAPEDLRYLLEWDFISQSRKKIDWFSLSDVDMTTARLFIDYLIEFCFIHRVPTRDTLLNRTDDINKYLYLCLKYKRCAICNMPAEVHHVDRVGMGRDREKIVHIGLLAIALCRLHHTEAHKDEKKLFQENYVYGIRLDKYLCDRLSLNTKERKS